MPEYDQFEPVSAWSFDYILLSRASVLFIIDKSNIHLKVVHNALAL